MRYALSPGDITIVSTSQPVLPTSMLLSPGIISGWPQIYAPADARAVASSQARFSLGICFGAVVMVGHHALDQVALAIVTFALPLGNGPTALALGTKRRGVAIV